MTNDYEETLTDQPKRGGINHGDNGEDVAGT